MEKLLEPFGVCAECYYEKAELRFREETAEKDGAMLRLERIPYYHCPRCGEETYVLDVEVFVEREMKKFMEGDGKEGAINVGAMFHAPSGIGSGSAVL